MLTNTYAPHVGGVARSVEGFVREFRRRGHRVVVAAPDFEGAPEEELDVVRFPAVQHFSGGDFSVPVLVPGRLWAAVRELEPEVVHSHHPFLLGDTALRVAAAHRLPVVFTHHTIYEQYTHYVPGDSPQLKRFVIDLVTGYCNLCNAVIAPSETVAGLLRRRGVEVPIEVIPTGVDLELFAGGDGAAFRRRHGIPATALVVGHVGRLAPEKNLHFLTRAVVRFLRQRPEAHFLLAGGGPLLADLQGAFEAAGMRERLFSVGVLDRRELAGCYQAMDLFAFASQTETQGMVLTEAMAAGVPVVAVDAPGVREVVEDGRNGRLLPREDEEELAAALEWVATRQPGERRRLAEGVAATAAAFSMEITAGRTLELYASVIGSAPARREIDATPWAVARRRVEEEWKLLRNVASAVGESMGPEAAPGRPVRKTGARRPALKERLLGWLWAALLWLQCLTWRKRFEGLEGFDRLLAAERGVVAGFWHGTYVPLFVLLRGRAACVFSSRSRRGNVIAEICRRFGYTCVQIPDRGGNSSLDRMRRALAEHRVAGIALDGPLGPYHEVKRGAVQLASDLGWLLVPVAMAARRKRVLAHRWDRMELPRPFTRVALVIGEPFQIPPAVPPEELESWRRRVREALDELDRRAAELVGLG